MSDPHFDAFYVAFSERFRGPYQEIKRRLDVHARTLRDAGGPPGPLLDLGSGRGEWLEIAREAGWPCTGVEHNETIAAKARERGFDVVHADILDYLGAAQGASFGVVSGFHVIEHLPAESQLRLVREAFRTLVPGGFLILEWPDAQGSGVAGYTFWVDPTHRALLPTELVAFMAEYEGFCDVRIQRLELGKVVKSPSFDVALVARKPR